MSMQEWEFAQSDPSQQLCRLHHFGVTRNDAGRKVEFTITVREYLTPPDPAMKFFATADKEVNTAVSPYLPSGWGRTLLDALSDCIRAINKFPL